MMMFLLSASAQVHAHIAEGSEDPAAMSYLFSYFKNNGEDGFHLAYSRDAFKWTPLRQDESFLKPEVGGKLMRDPCICRGPDGTFHMVWTSGWWDKGIGIAHSKDLVNWSEQKWLPVMEHEPHAMNCWAPEIFYDEATEEYLIFWSTTIPGRFPETDNTGDQGEGGLCNHRIYCVTTNDFRTWSDTRLFYDDGFNVIDATLVKHGDRYVMFMKDETVRPVAKKNIRMAFGPSARGPYGHASAPISPDRVEGPAALKVGKTWIVYFDEYTRGRYGAVTSDDMKNWKNISHTISFPEGARHGTAFPVPESVLGRLLEKESD